MIKRILKNSLLIVVCLSLFSFNLPFGWYSAGSDPDSYHMGIADRAGHEGNNAATIQSKRKKTNGFGTLMQDCSSDNYLGKRVRMTGYLKTKDVSEWAGFWLRVDQKDSEYPLSFDNMHDGEKDRSVKGTTDWTKYEIVLNVPSNACSLAYGALLAGPGKIWFDTIAFEIVSDTIPTTGDGSLNIMLGKEPINLDFEK